MFRGLTLAVLLCAVAAVSAQTWRPCSNIPDRISTMQMNLHELAPIDTMRRNWEWSFNFNATLSAPLAKGAISITLKDEADELVYDLTLPLCGEYSESACALNWKGKELFGMIPVITDKLGLHKVQLKIDAVSANGKHMLSSCYESEIEVEEFKALGCAQACGTIMAYTPGGNPAYCNGANQGTGYSCGGSGTWGLHYQCVELVQRATQSWFPVNYAAQMCNTHPPNFYRVTNPGAKDIFVSSWGTYGHTAVIRSNNGNGYVSVTEQNGSCNGLATYAISSASCFLRF